MSHDGGHWICICLFEQDLKEVALTREQSDLIGQGCAGPAVDLDDIKLTVDQVTDSFVEYLKVLESLKVRT